MKLYNTLSRRIEKFSPRNPPKVTLYSCGPTVYDYTHIGHIRTYVAVDLLKRALQYQGFKVKHVMNITDVGHLTGDDDTGEDKLEAGARRQKKTIWDVVKFFTKHFFDTVNQMNIQRPDIQSKATEHISDMILLIKKIEAKGIAYETDQAVYFDTTAFPEYAKLAGQKLEDKKTGARTEVVVDPQKRHPVDFALWFKRVGRFAEHVMHWDSPWGSGFPGWHIECSAMSMKYLGEVIDIHTGGIDHIPVHHTNELAQSKIATGEEFVRFWFHVEFLLVDGQKMSKSLNNFYTIDNIKSRGIEPPALRYLYLQTHYRQQINFTWESLKSAQQGYNKLRDTVLALKKQTQRRQLSQEKLAKLDSLKQKFQEAIANDLQIPQAVAVLWEVIKSNIPSRDRYEVVLDFDRVLGFDLANLEEEKAPKDIVELAEKREKLRAAGNYKEGDKIRAKISKLGYIIEDKDPGFRLHKKR